MQSIIAVLVVLVTQVSIPASAAPDKSLGNALQADAGSEIIKYLGKMEAAISDNSKSLSSIRQAVEANTKVEAVPEKSLNNALQGDAGSEIMKHLGKMEAAISDNSISLSNIRQAVEANTKDEAVPAKIFQKALQADPGSDFAKMINDMSKSLSSLKLAMESITKRFDSVESRMITCQAGEVKIPDNARMSEEFPIKLTGFKNTPKFIMSIRNFFQHERENGLKDVGFELVGKATSSTSAYVKRDWYGTGLIPPTQCTNIHVSYMACGN